MSIAQKLTAANEATWFQLGVVSELLNDTEKAIYSFENVLRHNPYNCKALEKIATLHRGKEQYNKSIEYLLRALEIEKNNGEIWGELGHCYLMVDDLPKAHSAYQNALYNLQNPKDTKLWYGIGILYDRYGSYDHAEEAFSAVLKFQPNFEKANEIYFRLGIIYKQQSKYDQSIESFTQIINNPPTPLTQADIWFQIGHLRELKKEFDLAKEAYEKVLAINPNHAKVLQQLGWIYHTTWGNQETAITYLQKSLDINPTEGQTWYLLGRCFMTQQQYKRAFDAYQQAVLRDSRNPTFWCSIGVLYYQINQYRDALDAYGRAIRLNPYLSEVWFDLGTLYESCKQFSDSLDAYQKAAELDPTNEHIHEKLEQLKSALALSNSAPSSVGNGNPVLSSPPPAPIASASSIPTSNSIASPTIPASNTSPSHSVIKPIIEPPAPEPAPLQKDPLPSDPLNF